MRINRGGLPSFHSFPSIKREENELDSRLKVDRKWAVTPTVVVCWRGAQRHAHRRLALPWVRLGAGSNSYAATAARFSPVPPMASSSMSAAKPASFPFPEISLLKVSRIVVKNDHHLNSSSILIHVKYVA